MSGVTPRVRLFTWALALVCVLAVCTPASWSSPEYRGVTILYTNDTHDHLLPFSYPDPLNSRVAYASMPFIKDIGGIARRATLANRIRAEVRGDALLVDAGDIMEGTPFGLEYTGEPDFEAMRAAGYDAAIPGNHDFRVSLDGFYRNLRIASFPILCANLIDRKTGKLAVPAYKVYDFRGAKIAVFGLTVPSPEYQAAKEGLDFPDPFETAKKLVPELRKHADIVIALSHLGSADDERLAKEVPGIDVIVGGHSHARLATPKFVPHGPSGAFSLNGTIILQAYEHGAELGRLDLRLRRNDGPFTLMSYSGRLIPVTSDIPDDPATARVVERYYRPISKHYDEIIGEATATLYNLGAESAVLNLICDSIREASGAHIAMYGIGGVRGDILQGPIRVWDIASVIPYAHKIVVLDMTGAQVKQILIRFPYKPGVSGMRYHMVGNQIIEATVDGKPIDDTAMYKLATIDWLVGLYFQSIPAGKTLDVTAQQAVVNYIKARNTISPVADGRKRAD